MPSASSSDVDEVVDFSFSCLTAAPGVVNVGPPTKLIFGVALAAPAVAAAGVVEAGADLAASALAADAA